MICSLLSHNHERCDDDEKSCFEEERYKMERTAQINQELIVPFDGAEYSLQNLKYILIPQSDVIVKMGMNSEEIYTYTIEKIYFQPQALSVPAHLNVKVTAEDRSIRLTKIKTTTKWQN